MKTGLDLTSLFAHRLKVKKIISFACSPVYMDNSNGSKLLRCSCETTSKEILTTKPLQKWKTLV